MISDQMWRYEEWYRERQSAAFQTWVKTIYAAAGPLKGNEKTWFERFVTTMTCIPYGENLNEGVEAAIVQRLRAMPLPVLLAARGTKIQENYAEWLAKVPSDLQPKAEAETGG